MHRVFKLRRGDLVFDEVGLGEGFSVAVQLDMLIRGEEAVGHGVSHNHLEW